MFDKDKATSTSEVFIQELGNAIKSAKVVDSGWYIERPEPMMSSKISFANIITNQDATKSMLNVNDSLQPYMTTIQSSFRENLLVLDMLSRLKSKITNNVELFDKCKIDPSYLKTAIKIYISKISNMLKEEDIKANVKFIDYGANTKETLSEALERIVKGLKEVVNVRRFNAVNAEGLIILSPKYNNNHFAIARYLDGAGGPEVARDILLSVFDHVNEAQRCSFINDLESEINRFVAKRFFAGQKRQ